MFQPNSSGSGVSSGSKNYLSAVTTTNGVNTGNGDFENAATTGWGLGNVPSLSNGFPSSTSPTFGSGSSVNLSLSLISSGQIAGSYSGGFTSSAATTAGDFLASSAFYIDKEDQAKALTFKFYYEVVSGASNANWSGTTSNSFGVAIWDVTNSAWIQPAGCFGMTQSSGVGYCTGTFQTTSNSTQYRLVVYNATATSGAITIYFDDFSIGPQTAPIGPVVTDWQSYTLTVGATTTPPTFGTITNNEARWRRVGDSIELYYDLITTSAGTNGSGTYLFPLPAGYSVDTTKFSLQSGTQQSVGIARIGAGGTGGGTLINGVGQVYIYDSTHLAVQVLDSANGITSLGGSADGAASSSGVYYSFTAKVPISGWSSNVQMSNDTDTRVITASASNGSVSVTSGTAIPFSSVAFDNSSSIASASGRFTAPVSGYYAVTVSSGKSTSGNTLNLYKNNSLYVPMFAWALANGLSSGSAIVQLSAGDYIDGRADGSFTISNYYFYVQRLSGPSVLAATDSIAARYNTTSGGSLTVNTTNRINFSTKNFDTTGSVTTGASWVFTAPISGKYAYSAQVHVDGVATLQNVALVSVLNGSIYGDTVVRNFAASTTDVNVSMSDIVSMNAGDTLYFTVNPGTTGSPTLDTSVGINYFSIARVGN